MNKNIYEIDEEKTKNNRSITLLDTEEIAMRYAIDIYNGNISEMIRNAIREYHENRIKENKNNNKIKKISILQIIAYMFIATDLLVIAIIFFSNSLLVMAITITSFGLLLFYSILILGSKIIDRMDLKWI